MKLRGRTEAPDSAEGAQFLCARGAKPQAHHGPLQRLLGGETPSSDASASCALLNRMSSSDIEKAANPAARTQPTAATSSPVNGLVAPAATPPIVQPSAQATKKPVGPKGIREHTRSSSDSTVAVPRIGNGVCMRNANTGIGHRKRMHCPSRALAFTSGVFHSAPPGNALMGFGSAR